MRCAAALLLLPAVAASCAGNITCDGSTDATTQIQSAFNACAAAGVALTLPPGTCLSQPLTIPSGLHLVVPSGSILKAGKKWDDASKHLLHASGAANVSITGAGTIDGSGSQWWAGLLSPSARPHLLHFDGSTDVRVDGVTLLNAAKFHLVLYGQRFTVTGVTIRSPSYLHAPNTDGIQIGAQDVTVSNCDVKNGDDSIVVKPGARNVLVQDSTVAQGNGLVTGTGGNIHDVVFRRCVVDGTQYGCHIKAKDDQTGDVSNVTFEHILVKSVEEHLGFDKYYPIGINQNGQSVGASSVHISNIVFRNITAEKKSTWGGRFNCNGGDLACRNITLVDVHLQGKCEFENVHGSAQNVSPSSCSPPA